MLCIICIVLISSFPQPNELSRKSKSNTISFLQYFKAFLFFSTASTILTESIWAIFILVFIYEFHLSSFTWFNHTQKPIKITLNTIIHASVFLFGIMFVMNINAVVETKLRNICYWIRYHFNWKCLHNFLSIVLSFGFSSLGRKSTKTSFLTFTDGR